jgi:hypothetical protein
MPAFDKLYYFADPASDQQKADIRGHWQHLEEARGPPFNDTLLMKCSVSK